MESIGLRGYAACLGEIFQPSSTQPDGTSSSAGLYLTGDLHALLLRAARETLTNAAVAPNEVDLVIHFSALPESQMVRPGSSALLDRFTYISSWLKEQLGLTKARVAGVQQQGCSAF